MTCAPTASWVEMRVLLDEHLSLGRVGRRLSQSGHDVACVAADASLPGRPDDELLAVAAESGRILVTRNARHFAPLAREWADQGRRHPGLLIVWSRDADEFGTLVDEIAETLAVVGDQASWADLTRAL